MSLRLKRVVADRGLADLLAGFAGSDPGQPFAVFDAHNNIVFGTAGDAGANAWPVRVGDETLGRVQGGAQAERVAKLLEYACAKELEKKALARETLDRYKEVNLLYTVSERISAKLDVQRVAEAVIEQARKIIRSDKASVMLLDENTGKLEILSASGTEFSPKVQLEPGKGIAGAVYVSGKAEIVNDVSSDPRFVPGNSRVHSMICAPITTKEKVIGVMSISSEDAHDYTAQDLKMFSALVTPASSAIENAILHERKLREERIKSNLERYVAAQVVSSIMASSGEITLDSEERHISILFSDIRNFTATCEKLTAGEIVNYLNAYFTHMVDVIFAHDGTVNKFVGDMILALFGAPTRMEDSEKRAIQSAITMQQALRTIPDTWVRDNFDTGIGINSGNVVVGNIGSPKHMDYTAIGDEVNVASRLQGMAHGGQILVSRNVYEVTNDSFDFKARGSMHVKGKTRPVDVFEVLWD